MEAQKSREDTLQKLYEHLPTSSTNDDLERLQVVGTSVYESEKAHVKSLMEK